MSEYKFEIGDKVVCREDAYIGLDDFGKKLNPEMVKGQKATIVARKTIFGPCYRVDTSKYWYVESLFARCDEPATADERTVTTEPPTASKINHPSYYNHGIECIDYIQSHDFGFCLGNAIKYITRAGYKTEDPREDLKKAIRYLEFELERIEKEGGKNA